MQYRYNKYKIQIATILLATELSAIFLLISLYLNYHFPQSLLMSLSIIAVLFLAGDYQNLETRHWGQEAVMVAFRIPLAIFLYSIICAQSDKYDLTEPEIKRAFFIIIDTIIVIIATRICFHYTLKGMFEKGRLYSNRLVLTFGDEFSSDMWELNNKGQNNHSTHINISKAGEDNINLFSEITEMIRKRDIDEVIWASESCNKEIPPFILHSAIEMDIPVKLFPTDTLLIMGFSSILNSNNQLLLQYSKKTMRPWEVLAKRVTDITLSLLGLIITTPFAPFIILAIKTTSQGPIFYLQERVGKNGKPFNIIKFRTMYIDAEKEGPALSSSTDGRITKAGRYLRKWRIDELPQFFNVLANQMSLIGPRPERQYFLDILKKDIPHITNYLTVKPGISSLGMVKFGYAENIEEMRRRFKYDLFYIQNQSYTLDLKIIVLTIKTILLGYGK